MREGGCHLGLISVSSPSQAVGETPTLASPVTRNTGSLYLTPHPWGLSRFTPIILEIVGSLRRAAFVLDPSIISSFWSSEEWWRSHTGQLSAKQVAPFKSICLTCCWYLLWRQWFHQGQICFSLRKSGESESLFAEAAEKNCFLFSFHHQRALHGGRGKQNLVSSCCWVHHDSVSSQCMWKLEHAYWDCLTLHIGPAV